MVTIIIATFNRSYLIEEMLSSVLDQTYKNWECLIIDDGSTDATQEVVLSWTKRDQRFKYSHRTEKYAKGLPGCRNYGLDLAKGDYIIFFDDDDIAHPDNLKSCLNEFHHRTIDYCRYLRKTFIGQFNIKFDRSDDYNVELLDNKDIPDIIIGKIPFNSCQVMWKSSCFDEVRFNEELMYAEEWECYSRILTQGVNGISIEKVLFYGRKHPKSNTGEFRENNPVRRRSKVQAAHLVLDTLFLKNYLNSSLVQFFVREGFALKEYSLLNKTLEYTNWSKFKILKYRLGFTLYPLLRPILKLKGKLLN
ncbi:glycosyltransferase family 2 protein [Christiangramia echinicola]|uniref:Glycosyltransferase involved in cell wall bisynthesis n=1 Tax=Christiangramia echinicola TaxID=279359 RepID=A0A1H1L3C9_9FLAO|nr:glycosyltransferase family 2 protein [Christiangramia echinicola]SDR69091.1 Glycosyltransferase involved in cell wall bisynthesis [Christiangramia echinicola]